MTATDQDLLQKFTREQSQDAFTALVQCHLNLVYSAALRQVRSPQLAEDVAQSVFIDLARNAARLRSDTILSAWLYEVTRRTAINVVRGEARRQLREQIASEMNTTNATAADWTEIEPLVDEAMHALDQTDRTAVLLRYFENKSLREVGEALGTSDDAAQKRVSRAVERLREFFSKRGVTIGAGSLIVIISTNAVQAAPAALAITVSASATLAATSITATATKAIAMTTMQKTLIAATLFAAVGAGIYEARQISVLRNQVQTLQQQNAEEIQQLKQERDAAQQQLAGFHNERDRLDRATAEVIKLRGEMVRLRADAPGTPSQVGSTNDQTLSEAVVWKNRVIQLKQYFEQSPGVRIPELQFVTEQDWLDAARGKLTTDADYRRASSALRRSGENKVASILHKALLAYMKANNEQFPTDLAQLQPYFRSPIDAATLDRWKIAPGKAVPNVGVGEVIITQKAPVDEVFDTRLVVGSGGGQGSTDFLPRELFDVMKPVHEAYRAAHNGQWQTDFSELQPYVTTPEQQAALEKLVLRNSK